jgi:hypothetical protein
MIKLLERKTIVIWRQIGSHKLCTEQPDYVYVILFEIPKIVLHKLDYYRSRFFWQGDNHKKTS